VVKLVAIGAVVCGFLYLLVGRGSEADAKDCFEKAGARVTQSTFFEEILGDHPAAKLGDEQIYDVYFGNVSAMVAFTGEKETAIEFAQFVTQAGPYAPEVVDGTVVVWTDEPAPENASAVRACVD
jgi:hypothetical protein